MTASSSSQDVPLEELKRLKEIQQKHDEEESKRILEIQTLERVVNDEDRECEGDAFNEEDMFVDSDVFDSDSEKEYSIEVSFSDDQHEEEHPSILL